MAPTLSASEDDGAGGWRIWLGPVLAGLPASLMLAVLSLPGPRIGQVAGAVMQAAGPAGFLALLRVDPELRLVDRRWGGRLIFVVSRRKDFGQLARQQGALLVFDAAFVGCGAR